MGSAIQLAEWYPHLGATAPRLMLALVLKWKSTGTRAALAGIEGGTGQGVGGQAGPGRGMGFGSGC